MVRDNILFGSSKRYHLHAYVVMDDHVHVVLMPQADEDLSQILHTWKSYTTNQMQQKFERKGRVWDSEYHNRLIREQSDLVEKCEYVITNPQRRWPEIKDYKWVGWE